MHPASVLTMDRTPTMRAWMEVDGFRWSWSERHRPTGLRLLCDPLIRSAGKDGGAGVAVVDLTIGMDLDRKAVLTALQAAVKGLEPDQAIIEGWREDFDLKIGEIETISVERPVPRRLLGLWADSLVGWSHCVLQLIDAGDNGSERYHASMERSCA